MSLHRQLTLLLASTAAADPLSASDAYDVIVVGAGLTGSAFAGSLAEKLLPGQRVLVLEAGKASHKSLGGAAPPATCTSGDCKPWPWSGGLTRFDVPGNYGVLPCWNRRCDFAFHDLPALQCKVLGGCGAVNGALMQRPQTSMFEGWPQGWSQQDLAPFLDLAEERLPHTATPSNDGKHYLEETGGAVLREALSSAGFSWLDDSSRPVAGAMGVPRVTARDGMRVSTASAVLGPNLDRLELLTEASAEKILFEGGRATALQVNVRGEERIVRLTDGGTLVLTAGAYNTPRLLMSSGVGAASGPSALESPAIENAHVGSGLSDKTISWQTYKIRGVESFSLEPPSDWALDQYLSNQSGPLAQFGPTLVAFYRHHDRTDGFDVEMFVSPSSTKDEVTVNFVLMQPRCSKGWLSLREGQVHQSGSLYLACHEDREVLAGAVALVTRQMLSIGGSVIASQGTGWPQGFAINHYTGTCSLGDCVDPSTLLVRGTHNVAVADASLLPSQVWGHPAMTLTAVAFKAADILAERLRPAEVVV